MSLQKYQGAIRNSGSNQQITFGVGGDYLWESAPTGLGIPTPDFTDTNLPGDGIYAGVDRLRKRIIRIPILLVADSLIESRINALKSGWRPGSRTKELDLRLEGAARRYYGRARGLEVDVTNIKQGVVTAFGNFETISPYAFALTSNTVAASTSGQIIVPNLGTAPSRRCVLTVVGNGSRPFIENRADPYIGFIRFKTTLANNAVRRINLNTFKVSTSDGQPRDNEISIETSFFQIEPHPTGNQIVFTGCKSVAASVRYAYL